MWTFTSNKQNLPGNSWEDLVQYNEIVTHLLNLMVVICSNQTKSDGKAAANDYRTIPRLRITHISTPYWA